MKRLLCAPDHKNDNLSSRRSTEGLAAILNRYSGDSANKEGLRLGKIE